MNFITQNEWSKTIEPAICPWDEWVADRGSRFKGSMVEVKRDSGPVCRGKFRGLQKLGSVIIVSTYFTVESNPECTRETRLFPTRHWFCSVIVTPQVLGASELGFHVGCCDSLTIGDPRYHDLERMSQVRRRENDGMDNLFKAHQLLDAVLYEDVSGARALLEQVQNLAAPHELGLRAELQYKLFDYLEREYRTSP